MIIIIKHEKKLQWMNKFAQGPPNGITNRTHASLTQWITVRDSPWLIVAQKALDGRGEVDNFPLMTMPWLSIMYFWLPNEKQIYILREWQISLSFPPPHCLPNDNDKKQKYLESTFPILSFSVGHIQGWVINMI